MSKSRVHHFRQTEWVGRFERVLKRHGKAARGAKLFRKEQSSERRIRKCGKLTKICTDVFFLNFERARYAL